MALLVASACAHDKGKNKKNKDDEFAGLGVTQSSSEPPPGIFLPVVDGDVEALQSRGQLLFAMERSLRLAYEKGAFEVGVGEGDVVLPLVDVDPGGASAQVVFLRWPASAVGQGGALHPNAAERWLLVSLLLSPDKVLDVELLGGSVDPKGSEYRRAQAILEAAKVLREQAPNTVYHLFTVPELVPGKKGVGHRLVTRIYAMAADVDGPDVELVVDEPRKRQVPPVIETRVVHQPDDLRSDPLVVRVAHPTPTTVARVLMRGEGAGEVRVRSTSGSWRVSAANGRVRRDAEGSPPAS